ncbi:Homeodomain-like protein, partial [Stachybotrys elegans]
WTPWEDQSLRNRIAQYGHARGSEGRWTEIAQGIPGRTAKDCRKRWFHSLDPSLRKGRWTEDEDRILLEAYSRLGPAWKQIADLIPGRKDDQCSKRYVDILGPLAKNRLSGWTPEEDQILRESVNDLGHRWAAVALKLPGRPPLTCRNRWRCLSKQAAAAKPTTAEQQTSPASVQPASDNDAGQSQSP